MNPNGHIPPHSDHVDSAMIHEGLADARTPLTVIQGSSQLLARRMRAGRCTTTDDVLRTLDLIIHSARALEAELRQVEEHAGKPK